MTLELRTYACPDLGFALDLPAEAELLEGVQGTVVVAVEPAESPLAFRANLNVVVERLEPGLGFDGILTEGHNARDRGVDAAAGGVGASSDFRSKYTRVSGYWRTNPSGTSSWVDPY